MTSQCKQTLGLNLFHPLIDLDGFITNCGSEWIIRGGAWLHILFIAVAAPQMDRWQFFLPSPQPALWWDLTKSQIIDENFVLKCRGALFVLHSSLATSSGWFTIIGWSTGNYLDNLASLRFSTDSGLRIKRIDWQAWRHCPYTAFLCSIHDFFDFVTVVLFAKNFVQKFKLSSQLKISV